MRTHAVTKRGLARALSLAATVGLAAGSSSSAHAGPPGDAPLETATQLGAAFSGVAERISPAVVSIQVETVVTQRGFGMFGGPMGESFAKGGGSGVLISADGDVLTNNHVVENARRIDVHLNDGRHFPATVVGTDPATDLAVLHIDARGLPAARFANSDIARVGQWVVAVGSPFGLDYTLTAGVLSAKGRGGLGANEIEDYLQTDASINPGNSGGPLVNLQGEVLGINTMIIGHASGIGFAIPSNLARQVANQLRESGQVRRAWIGVGYQELTPELASQFGAKLYRGALINQVVADGPAARGGLRSGDIVTKIGNVKVAEGRDLLRLILRHPVGEKVAVEVLRGGKTRQLHVVTGERPDQDAMHENKAPQSRHKKSRAKTHSLGVALTPLTPHLARQLRYEGPGGVVVADVKQGSAAERAGLMRGDVIEEIEREPVRTTADVSKALSKGGALFTLRRHGGTFYAVVKR